MTDPHSLSGRHPDEDLLLDLALSHVDHDVRDELTRHIALCETCRAEYSAIADAVDHVLPAAPRVAPSPGFSQSVLTAMGMAQPPVVRRRRRLVLAAAASVAFLLGAAGGAVVVDALGEEPVDVAAGGPALLTGAGARVGTVLESWYGGEEVLVVTVTGGRPGVEYGCELVYADGARASAGSWVLDDGASATWIVAPPETESELTSVELVINEGAAWASAKL